jgi:hypothetical protein
MVRPDLRRDMLGVLEISGPKERERKVEHNTQRERLYPGWGGSTLLSGESELQPSSRVLRK